MSLYYLSIKSMLYDVSSPLVDEYIAVFPDVSREAAAGSLNDIRATLSQGLEPAPVSPDSEALLQPIYEKIKADIEAVSEVAEEEVAEEEVAEEEVPGFEVAEEEVAE